MGAFLLFFFRFRSRPTRIIVSDMFCFFFPAPRPQSFPPPLSVCPFSFFFLPCCAIGTGTLICSGGAATRCRPLSSAATQCPIATTTSISGSSMSACSRPRTSSSTLSVFSSTTPFLSELNPSSESNQIIKEIRKPRNVKGKERVGRVDALCHLQIHGGTRGWCPRDAAVCCQA
jgi:hypothetical protein